MAERKLNERQLKFCAEYARGGVAYKAYLAAGYEANPEGAKRLSSQLLTNVDVVTRIEIEREDWRREIRHRFLAQSDHAMDTLLGIMDAPGNAAIARVSAANSVLDRAGFQPVQKTEVSGPNGAAIPHKIEVELVSARAKDTDS